MSQRHRYFLSRYFFIHADCVVIRPAGLGYSSSPERRFRLEVSIEERYEQRECVSHINGYKINRAQPLSTANEILMNAIWRFLTLREYVDADHNLTSWGKVLVKVIAALNGRPELEEAAIVAVELIRLGVLNWDEKMFPYQGAPIRGEREFPILSND